MTSKELSLETEHSVAVLGPAPEQRCECTFLHPIEGCNQPVDEEHPLDNCIECGKLTCWACGIDTHNDGRQHIRCPE